MSQSEAYCLSFHAGRKQETVQTLTKGASKGQNNRALGQLKNTNK